MKKSMVLGFCALALVGCAQDPVAVKPTDNAAFPVDKLFTVDGCTVYRFVDYGSPRYFASCAGNVSWREHHGKTSVNREIPTDAPPQ